MESSTIYGAFGALVCVGLLVLGLLISIRRDKRRSEALELAAASLGFEFTARPDAQRAAPYTALPLFQLGRGHTIFNHMRGDHGGAQVELFDYQYTVGHGNQRRSPNQTIVGIESTDFDLPDFTVGPEGIFAKIGSLFGYQDIDFDNHPDFSRLFLLRGSDEEAIRRVFTHDVLSYFERRRGITVEARADTFVFYRARKRAGPADLRGLLRDALGLFKELAGPGAA